MFSHTFKPGNAGAFQAEKLRLQVQTEAKTLILRSFLWRIADRRLVAISGLHVTSSELSNEDQARFTIGVTLDRRFTCA